MVNSKLKVHVQYIFNHEKQITRRLSHATILILYIGGINYPTFLTTPAVLCTVQTNLHTCSTHYSINEPYKYNYYQNNNNCQKTDMLRLWGRKINNLIHIIINDWCMLTDKDNMNGTCQQNKIICIIQRLRRLKELRATIHVL